MSELQWALLILSAIVVVAVIATSLRSRAGERRGETPPHLAPGAQLDILLREGQFDEFGVGRARQRGGGRTMPASEARIDSPPSAEHATEIPEAEMPEPEAPDRVIPQKIVSLLVVQPEGVKIAGPRIHDALQAQGLVYGERQIYHRLSDADPVFSVAGLLKPGTLDPAEAARFSTPGLSVFLVLPGPKTPREALRDMLDTARNLATALGAQVFDSRKRPLDRSALRMLADDVELWARENDV